MSGPSDDVTIFAPASGIGRAAVAVIRISGPATGPLLDRLAGTRPVPRRLSLRALRCRTAGEILDRALVTWMPAPHSFTGEDMAELHLHGGLAVRKAVLEAIATHVGCRLAEPGEFTRRAFLNGRLDLAEAEGIADLVDAETEQQRRQALRQLDGVLGHRVEEWRERAIALLARMEAALDFSDEDDVDESMLDAGLSHAARALRDEIHAVLSDDRRGERLREGFVVVLTGPPNAGKSTLLNALAGREAAIVSEIPGTTRDAIEVRCDLGGLPVILIDTAGLREATDAIEARGIARTRHHIEHADLVLDLCPIDSQVATAAQSESEKRYLRVVTKSDLGSCAAEDLSVSALTGEGLGNLLDAVQRRAERALSGDMALVTRARHRNALERASTHLDRVARSTRLSPELVAEDMRLATRALGEITGRVGVETILDRLFADFCIGK